VTGPTGSGKTVSLYTCLNILNQPGVNISTVEDPAEINLPGVNQVNVNEKAGLTFASALKALLRQDPDVIMIGEIRDLETAQIAVQASLTGHLVLSTLHTNTAAAAIIRLEDMGVERYLITSTVNGVLSQRLVRCLCTHCREPATLPLAALQKAGLDRIADAGALQLFTARGCDQCKQTGYRGRTSIHELFVMDATAHQAILDGADATTLHQIARRAGMLTLYEDGLRKVAAGITSLDELLRVTQDQGSA
jgi:general secretion pathway protein E